MLLVVLLCTMGSSVFAQMKAVDLGLSVKWANMNVGADSPEDYGDYFAWGEVNSKRYYGEYSSYKHFDAKKYHKYNFIRFKGSTVDNMLTLESSDDAASKQVGKGWRMPTEAEMTELLEKCVFSYATLNGTRGFWVKNSNEQGDSIFLPMAGYKDYGTYRYFPGTQSYYWTSSLIVADSVKSVEAAIKVDERAADIVRSALCLKYSGEDAPAVGHFERRKGCVIRPVRR